MKQKGVSWPHAPLHQLSESGVYFVTAGTYQKAHHFRGSERLSVLHRGLLECASKFGWQFEAWAVFSNHYHFVARSPAGEKNAATLKAMLGLLHERTAKWVNGLDGQPGRRVWFNYRDTRLTYQRSYLARLHYVHQNAVRHGLVPVAHLYPWGSAGWFERTASAAQVQAIYRFKVDQVTVEDDFIPATDW